MYIKDNQENSEETPLNAEEATKICMGMIYEMLISPAMENDLIDSEDYEALQEIGQTLRFVAQKALIYEKMKEQGDDITFGRN
jgi:hypothetical protein